MLTRILFFLFLSAGFCAAAQKKALDHSVYDGWQSIGERMISNDGRWIVYTVDPQEGDNELVIRSADATYKKTVERGYDALITPDNRYLVFRIKPYYKDIREAKIKKKKPDDAPKDSLGIIELGKDSIWKVARVKNYKTPDKGHGWIAYHLEKSSEKPVKGKAADTGLKKVSDSLQHIIDSLQAVIDNFPAKKRSRKDDVEGVWPEGNGAADADDDEPAAAAANAGTDLILRNIGTGVEKKMTNVLEYFFSEKGNKLLVEKAKDPKDSMSTTLVLLYDLLNASADTLSRSGNEFKNFALTKDGSQVAYLAERDAKPKVLQKFFKLWYYKEGMDSAAMLIDKDRAGIATGLTVAEYGNISFSKSGRRLFFGVAPIQPPKDTMMAEIDKVKVDVWHYNDDYIQPVQLNRLQRDLRQSFLAVYDLEKKKLLQLESETIPSVYQADEGDGDVFVGVTDYGKRVESQWTGTTKKDIYAINVNEGTNTLIKKEVAGVLSPSYVSPSGKYILWYDYTARNYFGWDGTSVKNITSGIKTPLYDEEHDSPSDPPPYGIMGWAEGDSSVYIYDRYDVWMVDLRAQRQPAIWAPFDGRKNKWSKRYIRTDPEERYISRKSTLLFNVFNEKDKTNALWLADQYAARQPQFKKLSFKRIAKAKDNDAFIYTAENYQSSPDLYVGQSAKTTGEAIQLSAINPQQEDYNWGTAELFKWKAYNGGVSEGIVYKPEDFDPAKKYPVICYFYETLSNGLYSYQPPAPTPSRLNISFFVSRGYVVFAPDIHYTTGHPGKDAYNYIVSGARALVKAGIADSTRIGIQGQSWGGYQVSYLITATNLFKAAWAGAPVANMTSAYGGIRWGSGLNRQFQYEKTQSRIGATLWEKPELYIENSPLFHLPKVKTPLVIMHNDADGAVPWYQGIELYTAMRRLGKKVWMLNYNGEDHNLVERKNRKDISIREQQYFDWLLKDAKPARWIAEGVPATKKGKDWGLDLVE